MMMNVAHDGNQQKHHYHLRNILSQSYQFTCQTFNNTWCFIGTTYDPNNYVTQFDDATGFVIFEDDAGPGVCELTSAEVTMDCGDDICSEGELVNVSASMSAGCTESNYFLQVDMKTVDGTTCILEQSGGDMVGIGVVCDSNECDDWTVPLIADECKGQTVNAIVSAIYSGNIYDQENHVRSPKEIVY